LNSAEEEMRSFMNPSQLIELDEQTKQLVNAIAALEAEKQAVMVNLVAVNSAIDSYQAELDSLQPGLAIAYEQNMAPQLNRLQYRLSELETQRVLLIARNPELREQPNEPQLNRLDEQISTLQKEIHDLTASFI